MPSQKQNRCPPKRLLSDRSDEETNAPLIADHRNFYKVEKTVSISLPVGRCCLPKDRPASESPLFVLIVLLWPLGRLPWP